MLRFTILERYKFYPWKRYVSGTQNVWLTILQGLRVFYSQQTSDSWFLCYFIPDNDSKWIYSQKNSPFLCTKVWLNLQRGRYLSKTVKNCYRFKILCLLLKPKYAISSSHAAKRNDFIYYYYYFFYYYYVTTQLFFLFLQKIYQSSIVNFSS